METIHFSHIHFCFQTLFARTQAIRARKVLSIHEAT
jgi:hypothetical protein